MASNVKAAKYHMKPSAMLGPQTFSGSNIVAARRAASPPNLFNDGAFETAMIENLKVKMHDFNAELQHEMSVNQKLTSQCQAYSDKLAVISSQFDNYRMKTEAKIDVAEEKLNTMKQQLREEKDAVNLSN